jgi:hypothetical protein
MGKVNDIGVRVVKNQSSSKELENAAKSQFSLSAMYKSEQSG